MLCIIIIIIIITWGAACNAILGKGDWVGPHAGSVGVKSRAVVWMKRKSGLTDLGSWEMRISNIDFDVSLMRRRDHTGMQSRIQEFQKWWWFTRGPWQTSVRQVSEIRLGNGIWIMPYISSLHYLFDSHNQLLLAQMRSRAAIMLHILEWEHVAYGGPFPNPLRE